MSFAPQNYLSNPKEVTIHSTSTTKTLAEFVDSISLPDTLVITDITVDGISAKKLVGEAMLDTFCLMQ